MLTWRFPKSATMMDQPKDERLEGDEPQIEANPEEEEPRENQPREAEEEEPELAGRDGLDQGPAQLSAEAEEQAQAEEEEKARRILEETELKSFRLALPMRTKTSREVTSTVMEMWLKLRADGYHVGHIHSDRGHEFQGALTQWARARGIHLSRTSGDGPRANGRAEACVKAIKDQVRRTLRQACEDSSKWPPSMALEDPQGCGGTTEMER